MRKALAVIAVAAGLAATILAMPDRAEARCQGCLEGPMTYGTVPFYASGYDRPSYYYVPHRYVRYAPYDRWRYAPRRYYPHRYTVRPYW